MLNFHVPIKPQITLKLGLLMGQNRVKGSFLLLGVVLHSFSSGTILIDEIKTNQLEL